jgi:protein-S-isoprenylcysteine O-methyltransferase Ste14
LHFDFSSSWYRPFFGFFWVATLAVLVLSLPYFYLCERFGRWSQGEDDLLCIVRGYLALVRGRKPEPAFLAVWRGYLVKFFFVPLMVVFWISNTQTFEKALLNLLNQEHWWSWDVYAISRLYDVAFEGMFLVDVSLALLGYICTFRLFDTHIRSAEPTLVGWFVALACYPPFSRTADLYLAYNNGQHYWGSTLANYPVLFALVAATIIFLQFVYAYSTVMFGLRFSNLTNRGILCKGPYAVIRHPAYVAKNISWWLVSLPFLFSFGDCVRLLCMNALYVGRAITEERHLGRDPDYQEYMRRVKYRFIPGVW